MWFLRPTRISVGDWVRMESWPNIGAGLSLQYRSLNLFKIAANCEAVVADGLQRC